MLADDVNVPKEHQQPFVFLQELVRPGGQWNTPFQYPLPGILQAGDNAWQSDEQFGREFLAGLNPVMISCVKEFPLQSALDPAVYGDPTSAIAPHHIEGNLEGLTVDQAVSEKKLFVADYHDAYLPFVERINALLFISAYCQGTTRSLWDFVADCETLRSPCADGAWGSPRHRIGVGVFAEV